MGRLNISICKNDLVDDLPQIDEEAEEPSVVNFNTQSVLQTSINLE